MINVFIHSMNEKWVKRAFNISFRAGCLAIALKHYIKLGRTQFDGSLVVSNQLVKSWGFSPKQKRAAIRELAEDRMFKVQWDGRKAPRVWLK